MNIEIFSKYLLEFNSGKVMWPPNDLGREEYFEAERVFKKLTKKIFKPRLRYYSSMGGYFLYLSEDVSYRSSQLGSTIIDILYHPYEERVVGIKINCINSFGLGPNMIAMIGDMVNR